MNSHKVRCSEEEPRCSNIKIGDNDNLSFTTNSSTMSGEHLPDDAAPAASVPRTVSVPATPSVGATGDASATIHQGDDDRDIKVLEELSCKDERISILLDLFKKNLLAAKSLFLLSDHLSSYNDVDDGWCIEGRIDQCPNKQNGKKFLVSWNLQTFHPPLPPGFDRIHLQKWLADSVDIRHQLQSAMQSYEDKVASQVSAAVEESSAVMPTANIRPHQLKRVAVASLHGLVRPTKSVKAIQGKSKYLSDLAKKYFHEEMEVSNQIFAFITRCIYSHKKNQRFSLLEIVFDLMNALAQQAKVRSPLQLLHGRGIDMKLRSSSWPK